MYVGVGSLVLHIPSAHSLKDKRQITRSFKGRVRARLKISIAEVGDLDLHQRAELGFAVVSNDASVCDELLSAVIDSANTLRDALLLDHRREIIPFGKGGKGLAHGALDASRDPRSDELWPSEDQENDDG